MARRNTRPKTRAKPARRQNRSRSRKKRPFVLRWYHLVAACVAFFCLGFLTAFSVATRYVSTVAGLR